MEVEIFISKIRRAIVEGDLEQAIQFLNELTEKSKSDYRNEVLSISYAYQDLRKEIELGTISDSEKSLSKNKIIARLLGVLTKIEGNKSGEYVGESPHVGENPPKEGWKKLVYIVSVIAIIITSYLLVNPPRLLKSIGKGNKGENASEIGTIETDSTYSVLDTSLLNQKDTSSQKIDSQEVPEDSPKPVDGLNSTLPPDTKSFIIRGDVTGANGEKMANLQIEGFIVENGKTFSSTTDSTGRFYLSIDARDAREGYAIQIDFFLSNGMHVNPPYTYTLPHSEFNSIRISN